jgi:hypothetical protein
VPARRRALLVRATLAAQLPDTGDRTIQLMASSSWVGVPAPSSACPDHRPEESACSTRSETFHSIRWWSTPL